MILISTLSLLEPLWALERLKKLSWDIIAPRFFPEELSVHFSMFSPKTIVLDYLSYIFRDPRQIIEIIRQKKRER